MLVSLTLYSVICMLVFFLQERILFVPEKLGKGHLFHFDQPFEERTIVATDGVKLSGVLFTSEHSRGLIFLMHGNAGSLESIGGVATTFTSLNFDVFILDYRGFGKSEGKISSETQLFDDVQMAYDALKEEYPENKIILLGYSIGSGLAAKLASENHAHQLILEAPYYSLTDLMRHKYPFLPTFLLSYKMETNHYLKKCQMPITIFHGTKDGAIYYGSSLKLKQELKEKVALIPLPGLGHNGFSTNEIFLNELKNTLND